MAFAALGDRGQRENTASDRARRASSDYETPPAYKSQVGREETLRPSRSWWSARGWGKRAWAVAVGVVVLILVIIVVIVVAAVVASKGKRYPDYATQTYALSETFSGDGFFSDNFDYFTGYDPTAGHVHYVPAEMAASYNLTYASPSSAVLRVDTSCPSGSLLPQSALKNSNNDHLLTSESSVDASTGRFSVRVTSKKQYGLNTLFIFDVKHSPMGCGTWPALWLTDPSNWPTNGEIDVMEAVNTIGASYNQMTLHTSSGCSMKSVKRKESGSVIASNCANTTSDNAGCGVNAGADTTFGSTFNARGGGVLALELREAGIRMWQFARAVVPPDVWSSRPDPNGWGTATADFPNTDCDIGKHFRNQSIVANIDLCGTWAGATSTYSEHCPGTCVDHVSINNTAFTDAYWEFGNFTIFSVS
ncbi:hypothetical protein LZ554_008694 [Drepanopeziza brunnea f. sp. 'monogermtubi']|nr:hypothetical protein LZ554_008694 [Drepanopeziza brunnea f. sp. 'monogermtubi']